MGNTASETYMIKIASADITQALPLKFNIVEGEKLSMSEDVYLFCEPIMDTNEEFTVTSIQIVDSADTSLPLSSTDCASLNFNQIEVEADCLEEGETYTFS